jgi:hypothetical protein
MLVARGESVSRSFAPFAVKNPPSDFRVFRACHGVAHAKPGVSWLTIRHPFPSAPSVAKELQFRVPRFEFRVAEFATHVFAFLRVLRGKNSGSSCRKLPIQKLASISVH